MPPKTVSKRAHTGKNVASSSNPAIAAPPHYDPDILVSVEAAKDYLKIMKKAVQPKRGFQLTLGHYPAIDNIITRRSWSCFVEQPTIAVIPVLMPPNLKGWKRVSKAESSSTTPRTSTSSIAFAMFRFLQSMTKRPRTWITISIVVPYA